MLLRQLHVIVHLSLILVCIQLMDELITSSSLPPSFIFLPLLLLSQLLRCWWLPLNHHRWGSSRVKCLRSHSITSSYSFTLSHRFIHIMIERCKRRAEWLQCIPEYPKGSICLFAPEIYLDILTRSRCRRRSTECLRGSRFSWTSLLSYRVTRACSSKRLT